MLDQLKSEIAKLVAQQRAMKPQRKTVHFVGNRTVPAWEATNTIANNRFMLRHLYIVYALLRNKTIDQVEPNRKSKYSEFTVGKLMEKYKPVEVTEEVAQ